MEKLNISRKEVEEEAERLGLKLNEKIFEVKKAQRGRPKKSTDVVDTASESSEISEPVKRGRGRPKKETKPVTEDTNDMQKNKISKVEIPEVEISKVETPIIEEKKNERVGEEDQNESDEDELAVTEFIHKGIKYLKAEDITLYDVDTHEEVGSWDPMKNKIILD